MTEVLYYAVPFFILLLLVEAMTYRHLQADELVGYDFEDTRTSLLMGTGNVVVNSQGMPVVMELDQPRSSVTRIRFGWGAPCTPEGNLMVLFSSTLGNVLWALLALSLALPMWRGYRQRKQAAERFGAEA